MKYFLLSFSLLFSWYALAQNSYEKNIYRYEEASRSDQPTAWSNLCGKSTKTTDWRKACYGYFKKT